MAWGRPLELHMVSLVRLRVRVRGGVGVGVRVERRQAVLALGTTHVGRCREI